jgi:hypothetical protein
VLASRGRVKCSVPLDPSEDLGVVGEPVRVRTVVGEPGEAQRLVRELECQGVPPRTAPLDLESIGPAPRDHLGTPTDLTYAYRRIVMRARDH